MFNQTATIYWHKIHKNVTSFFPVPPPQTHHRKHKDITKFTARTLATATYSGSNVIQFFNETYILIPTSFFLITLTALMPDFGSHSSSLIVRTNVILTKQPSVSQEKECIPPLIGH